MKRDEVKKGMRVATHEGEGEVLVIGKYSCAVELDSNRVRVFEIEEITIACSNNKEAVGLLKEE